MNCKDNIKKLLNIHPDENYSYSYLYEIAYNLTNKAQYLERIASVMAVELDALDADTVVANSSQLSPEELYRNSLAIRVAKAAVEPRGNEIKAVQQSLMKFDPATGEDKPYPSHAEQYRKWHGGVAWLVNPWTGKKRHAMDIGSDVFGTGITETSDD